MVSRRRALARSDGASGLRWLDRAPCAPKFLWGEEEMRSSLNRLGREPSLGRANVFQPAGRRRRALSRARLDGTQTRRVGARRVRFVRTIILRLMRANTASERASEPGRVAIGRATSTGHHFSNGAPGVDGSAAAAASNSATSASSSLHPRQPTTASACRASFAPGMGTVPLVMQ